MPDELVAALSQLPYGCGLGMVSLMQRDVAARSLVAGGGALPLRRVEPDVALVKEFAAPAGRIVWW